MNESELNADQADPAKDGAGSSSGEHHEEHSADANAAPQEKEEGAKTPSAAQGFSRYERASAVIQAATLIVVGVYTVFSCQMWQAMRDANNLTKKNDAASNKIIESNAKLAEAARVSAAQAKRLADSAQNANDLTRKSATSAASREERLFRLAHRARVGAVQVENLTLQPGIKYEIRVTYRNDPLSAPAVNVVSRAGGRIQAGEPKELVFTPYNEGHPEHLTLAPGATNFIPIIWGPIGKDLIDAVNAGKMRAYVFGSISYTDEFGTDGALEFCFFHNPERHDWRFCASHNTTK